MNCEKCGADNLEVAITCIKCGDSIFGASNADKPKPNSITLWSPDKAALFSFFLLSVIFGAIIHALNWKKLGQNQKAIYSWIWAVAIFIIINLSAVYAQANNYNFNDFYALSWLIQVVSTLLWYFTFGRSQSKYVFNQFKHGYTKRSWLAPICISIIIWGGLIWLGQYAQSEAQFVKY